MRLLLALAALCTTVLISQTSQAVDNTKCLCWTSIGIDAGHTSRQCEATGPECECTAASLLCTSATTTSGSCPTTYSIYGTTATGLKCCVKGCRRDAEPQDEVAQQTVEATTTESLENVFEGTRTAAWYGYDDGVNKSPSAGRSNAQAARLDACMGHLTVTGYGIGSQLEWNRCNSDCDSSTNGHCDASGTNNGIANQPAFRCKDRCDCHIGNYNGSTCENL